MTRKPIRRRGLALIPALACLALVGLLCAATLRMAHTQRSAAADEERRMQTEWLAEAGLARAAARLAADPGYHGETWDVTLDDSAGVVRIAVEADDARPGRRRVRVEADYPRGDTPRRARLGKRLTIENGTERPKGPS